MKVIFTSKVGGITPGTEREVAEGYALNYLLPKGLAIAATPEARARVTQGKQREASARAQAEAQAGQAAEQLRGRTVTVLSPASSTGTLYAAVAPEAVTAAIREKYGIILTSDQVRLLDRAKTVGEHQLTIALGVEGAVPMVLSIKPSSPS